MEVLFARPVRAREIIARALLAPLFNYKLLRDCFSKKVRAKRTISPPIFTFARNGRMWGVALRRQVPFLRYAPRFFQGNGKRALAHEVVRTNLFEKIPTLFGIFL